MVLAVDIGVQNFNWLFLLPPPPPPPKIFFCDLDSTIMLLCEYCSLKVFLVAGIIGIFVILPVNCTGDQLEDIDFSDFSNNSLDVFTISNISSGSKR